MLHKKFKITFVSSLNMTGLEAKEVNIHVVVTFENKKQEANSNQKSNDTILTES